MPTLRRPEMLALSLERIAQNRYAKLLDVRIFLDTSSQACLEEVGCVRNTYFPEALLFQAGPHLGVPSGMWNILNSLKQGYETGADFVFLIEEDVLIFPDYFDWHLGAQEEGEYLATCGRRIPRLPEYDQYTNPGSCFSGHVLARVVKHINYELFSNRTAYMKEKFGHQDEVSDLDDGLIRRIVKQLGARVRYPMTPKCAHIGFQAYNRYHPWINRGALQERILGLRSMMTKVDPQNRYTSDFELF
jgi:hypothetical protein